MDMPSGEDESSRRLATILAADIAGYSKLVGLDEEGTLARVRRQRREIMEPTVKEHRGRIVKWTGDGFFAQFDSPVEAVRCAVVIQQAVFARNAALPKPRWIQYRIGVHVGDIVIEGDDIFGDSVNVASRLEGLADPGGIYISESLYGLIKNKLVVGYQPLGDHKVKNITDPITVYRVLPDLAAVSRLRRRARLAALATVGVIACTAGAGALWLLAATHRGPAAESASAVAAAAPQRPSSGDQTAAVIRLPEASEGRSTTPFTEAAMIALPGGSFMMGSGEDPSERPAHKVTVAPFSIGKYPVTVKEWRQCVAARACADVSAPSSDESAPISNLSWNDAIQFTSWLSRVSGKNYRLPTEAEWEYAARGGTSTKFWWGNEYRPGMAYCRGCGTAAYDPRHAIPVGSFRANPFGLYDMGGEASEWVSDCWHDDYRGAPSNGSSWATDECSSHVLRGGSWQNDPSYLSVSSRDHYDTGVRYLTHGLRLALGGEK
jgi:formylglycine-generating enzyme required for sulfatase activity/class 3 adenylate cyclase